MKTCLGVYFIPQDELTLSCGGTNICIDNTKNSVK